MFKKIRRSCQETPFDAYDGFLVVLLSLAIVLSIIYLVS